MQQQQNKPSRPTTAPAKTKPSKPSPLPTSTANNVVTAPTNIPTPSTSVSPPVKKESPQITTYPRINGNMTPLGSNTSSVITTPSPPITPSSNPPLSYQHDSYNSFHWQSNGHNSSPHHYYSQNYNPAYYSQMEYFNQQTTGHQGQVQMSTNPMGGTAYQMTGYPSSMTVSMGSHHQNFSPRHPDCSLEYMGQDKYQMV